MKRRHFLLASAAAGLSGGIARAGSEPWRGAFLQGRFDGTSHAGGLHIVLAAGWKTYWRVPGAGGIAPAIEAMGPNLKNFGFDCPLPQRFAGPEGETIGYKGEVVFPFTAEPVDPAHTLEIALSAFIGICEIVCIPAQIAGKLVFAPQSPAADARLLSHWQSQVPSRSVKGPVISARAVGDGALLGIEIALAEPVRDIFVEGGAHAYFGAPQFTPDRLTARLAVTGIAGIDQLRGQKLRLTIDTGAGGVEQILVVA